MDKGTVKLVITLATVTLLIAGGVFYALNYAFKDEIAEFVAQKSENEADTTDWEKRIAKLDDDIVINIPETYADRDGTDDTDPFAGAAPESWVQQYEDPKYGYMFNEFGDWETYPGEIVEGATRNFITHNGFSILAVFIYPVWEDIATEDEMVGEVEAYCQDSESEGGYELTFYPEKKLGSYRAVLCEVRYTNSLGGKRTILEYSSVVNISGDRLVQFYFDYPSNTAGEKEKIQNLLKSLSFK